MANISACKQSCCCSVHHHLLVPGYLLLDHDDYLPAYVLITEAKRSDVKIADFFPLNRRSIVVDRAYNDYAPRPRVHPRDTDGPVGDSLSAQPRPSPDT